MDSPGSVIRKESRKKGKLIKGLVLSKKKEPQQIDLLV
jgi:hypothetical protein